MEPLTLKVNFEKLQRQLATFCASEAFCAVPNDKLVKANFDYLN